MAHISFSKNDNQICKKYGLENSLDKKTSDETCDIFQK